MKIEIRKKMIRYWFTVLQDIVCLEIENLEKEFSKRKNKLPNKFEHQKWRRSNKNDGGGAEFRILRNGLVFEKVGVNFSEVYGKFNKYFKSKIPGAKKNPKFWASGISVVMHMKNPKIPAMHFNTRFICTQKSWFGGGTDITPSIKDSDEAKWFHKQLKITCDLHNKKYYPKYKKWCDDYFYLKHRKEIRGIGGIFFDYKMDNWNKDFAFIKNLGNTFVYIFKTIIKKKMFKKWTKEEKEFQLQKRGRYVEYNLLYDRGTQFGLNTGGNIDAILMSLPPIATWK
jgi:coproporphyrinogen III oxidase